MAKPYTRRSNIRVLRCIRGEQYFRGIFNYNNRFLMNFRDDLFLLFWLFSFLSVIICRTIACKSDDCPFFYLSAIWSPISLVVQRHNLISTLQGISLHNPIMRLPTPHSCLSRIQCWGRRNLLLAVFQPNRKHCSREDPMARHASELDRAAPMPVSAARMSLPYTSP